MESADFAEAVASARRGEADAADRLVRQFEPYIRRVVRLRLQNRRMCRTVGSGDVCQSVFADFFRLLSKGRFRVESSEGLKKLLVTMALNRLRSHARRERRAAAALEMLWGTHQQDCAPERQLEADELLAIVRSRLASEESEILRRRIELGQSWAAIAVELDRTPDSVRMQLARAIMRLRRELGGDRR